MGPREQESSESSSSLLSQSLVPIRIRPTIPTSDVLSQRASKLLTCSIEGIIGASTALSLLLVYIWGLFGGFSLLWQLLVRLHLISVSYLLTLVFLGCFVLIVSAETIHKLLENCIQVWSCRHLYRCCRYADPVLLARSQISVIAVLHPDLVTYTFSGAKVVVMVGKKAQLHTATPISTQLIEKTPVSLSDLDEEINVDLQDEIFREESISIATTIVEKSLSSVLAKQQQDGIAIEEETLPSQSKYASNNALVKIQEELKLYIIIGPTVSLLLEEKQTGVKKYMPLDNENYKAIMAYLATRKEKDHIDHIDVKRHIYDGNKGVSNVQDSFNASMSRIRKKIRDFIKKEFSHYATKVEEFDPFEQQRLSKYGSRWRLSPHCTAVEGFGRLNYWSQKIQAIKKGSDRNNITPEKLRKTAHLLIRNYSKEYLEKEDDESTYIGGYLVLVLRNDPFKNWASGFFKEYRKKYIDVLTCMAEMEYSLGTKTQKEEHVDWAARLYKECAYAATCNPIDHIQGEHALRMCIEVYMALQKVEEAENVYRVYDKRVKNILWEWHPMKETTEFVLRYRLTLE